MSSVETQVEPKAMPGALGSVSYHEFRVTTAHYRKMVDAGVFGRGDRVFLWHGKLVEKMTKGRRHSYAALKLDELLGLIIPEGFHLELEQPMDLGDDTLPEPDLMVVRGPLDEYQTREPTPGDLVWIVEVADSSLPDDRGEVLRDYARVLIPIYWLVNIPQRRVEVYSGPSGPVDVPSFANRVDFGLGTEMPVILDGIELGQISINKLFP